MRQGCGGLQVALPTPPATPVIGAAPVAAIVRPVMAAIAVPVGPIVPVGSIVPVGPIVPPVGSIVVATYVDAYTGCPDIDPRVSFRRYKRKDTERNRAGQNQSNHRVLLFPEEDVPFGILSMAFPHGKSPIRRVYAPGVG